MMILVASVLLIAFGLMCLFERDMAFHLYEYDAKLMGKVLRRTQDWDSLMRTQGLVMLMVGFMGFFIGLR
jgi:hypothetical protein